MAKEAQPTASANPPAMSRALKDRTGQRVGGIMRAFDRFLTGDYSKEGKHLKKPPKSRIEVDPTVVIKVQAWDGELPMMPLIMLEAVPRDVNIYPLPGEPVALGVGTPQSLTSAPGKLSPDLKLPTDVLVGAAPVGLHADPGSMERAEARQLKSSLLHEVMVHPTFKDIYRRAQLRRRADVRPRSLRLALRPEKGGLPTFFYHGMRILRPTDKCTPTHGYRSINRVKDVMRMSPKYSVGYTEVTLDLALNREADIFLTTQCYEATYTFAVRVESVELHASAEETVNDRLPPSTYVCVEHAGRKRYSQIEPETRTPIFDWMAGSIKYSPNESLKLRVYIARNDRVDPENDLMVGQVWLPAPVLPVTKALAHPELLALSLGTNVGVIHVSLRGPAVRRTSVQGCLCWCCGCPCAVCGSPPCVPACSVTARRTARFCCSVFTSFKCRLAVALFCLAVIIGVIVLMWYASTIGFVQASLPSPPV